MLITIPANYVPRSYQIPFLRAMDSGTKRAVLVWHRRSGKTKSVFNFEIKKAHERIGTYFHCFPEYGQGRKVIWDGIDFEGNRVLDYHVPQELRKNTNKAEMKIELKCGSFWHIIGADNYDSLVGPNPVGLVLDEWAVSDRYQQAWDYFRPILAENGGWAIFVYTPRGMNHGWNQYQIALRNPNWFCQLLTVDDTQAVTQEAIQEERDAGMSEDMIQQEFYCSFLASTENIVIPFVLIQAALKRDVNYARSGRIGGCDVARFGNDRTAFVIRQAGQIIHVDFWKSQDIVKTAGKLIREYRNKLYDCIAIDTIGIGAGVYDMVKNANVPCIPVNVAEKTSDDSRFRRLRDELWWKLREWFQDQNCSISSGIPEEKRDALVADINDIRYSYSKIGQIIVEPKEEMKKRLDFSPDIGDALCCTFAPGIEMRLQEIERSPFGIVERHEMQINNNYDPLRHGLTN